PTGCSVPIAAPGPAVCRQGTSPTANPAAPRRVFRPVAQVLAAEAGMSELIRGRPPAVALINPKYPHNVGAAVRACSCWGVPQLWWTGNRVTLDLPRGERLPREERMKGYRNVMV